AHGRRPRMTPFAIRADANATIGAGHAMRSLALAQAWRRRGGDVTWFTVTPPPLVRAAVEQAGVSIEPSADADRAWSRLVRWIESHDGAWVAFDNYDLDLRAQRAAVAAGARLLVVDDCAFGAEFDCDILLNQSIGADSMTYRTAPRTRCLLGPRYAL